MNIQKLITSVACLGIAGLVGCITPSKPKEVPAEPIKAAAAAPEPADAIPPGLAPKFMALLTGEDITQTTPEMGQAAKLVAAWNNKVVYAPDPTQGGEPIPGLVVRLWVFGPDVGEPIEPDGELLVALWDVTPKASGGKPLLRELWHIDRETARKFSKKDAVGPGYTLLLPWSNYHVDVKQANLLVRYNGADGRNLAAPPERLSIDHSATLQKVAEQLGMKKGAEVPAIEEDLKLPEMRAWPEK